MNILLFGMPGSGKGTVAKQLQKELNLTHLSQGDLLREELNKPTEKARAMQREIALNGFVPNELGMELVFSALEKHEDGFILDGFPRSMEQQKQLEKFLEEKKKVIDLVLYLHCEEEVVKKRILARNRPEDAFQQIDTRIEKFNMYTLPVVRQYEQMGVLQIVDGSLSKEEVWKEIQKWVSPSR